MKVLGRRAALGVTLALAAAGCASEGGPEATPAAPSTSRSVIDDSRPAPSTPATTAAATPAPPLPQTQTFPVPAGSRPHDVAPAADGTVWYTAQGSGELGRLDPRTGATHHVKLGPGSAPHGVIVGPD